MEVSYYLPSVFIFDRGYSTGTLVRFKRTERRYIPKDIIFQVFQKENIPSF
jgi:hypothetical protein